MAHVYKSSMVHAEDFFRSNRKQSFRNLVKTIIWISFDWEACIIVLHKKAVGLFCQSKFFFHFLFRNFPPIWMFVLISRLIKSSIIKFDMENLHNKLIVYYCEACIFWALKRLMRDGFQWLPIHTVLWMSIIAKCTLISIAVPSVLQ